MSYWGLDSVDCDFAFDHTGAIVLRIVERMFDSLETVTLKGYPEQSVVVSLTCLRKISEISRKLVVLHLGRLRFEQAVAGFLNWYELVHEKIPSEYREAVLAQAEKEFALFRLHVYDEEQSSASNLS